MRRTAIAVLAALVPAAGVAQVDSLPAIDVAGLHAHTAFLASDLLRGRAPATRGAEIAAAYIASQFMRVGLQPPGDDYFQSVPLVGTTVDPAGFSLGFESLDTRVDARYDQDAVAWPAGQRFVQVGAELVFVGYGVEAPEFGWDDFKGRDLTGKVLLILVGDPPAPPDDPRLFDGRALTYYGRWNYKLEEAARRGAAGALLIHTPDAAGYGWDVVRSSFTGEQLSLPSPPDRSPLAFKGWIHYDFAQQVIQAAGLDLDELFVRAARSDFRPLATGLTVRARMGARVRELVSANVGAILPGATRPDEAVVVTAHYDHLGVGRPVDGDSIYNGAYDNAIGVAVMLEMAEALSRADPPPARSIVFLATTAEEAGLLGAEHYVRQPILPLQRTAAALNIDGASLWGETDDLILIGSRRSTLGAIATANADALGIQLVPDRTPEKGYYFRSDHFPFAQHGVPAIHIEHGSVFRGRPIGWGAELLASFERQHYHAPSDEYHPELDLSGAAQLARLLARTARDAADPERLALPR